MKIKVCRCGWRFLKISSLKYQKIFLMLQVLKIIDKEYYQELKAQRSCRLTRMSSFT